MSWFSKKPITKTVKKSELVIRCKTRTFSWTNDYIEGRQLEIWRDFVKWFHCRPQSQCHTVRANNGESYTTMLRSEIVTYSIKMVEL